MTALDERRAEALRLDDYVATLAEEQRFARDRLKFGEEEAEIQREINRLRAEGVVVSDALEEQIRGTTAETRRLNKAWDDQQQAIKDFSQSR
ncbi:MAG: hypothetical protein ACMVO3_22655 [Thalassobaculum sp.]